MKKSTKIFFRLSIVFNIVLAFLLGLLIVRFKSEIMAKFTASKSYPIVIFGDSLIFNADWNSKLERNDIYNAGMPGFTTSHFVWLLNEKVIKHQPKICFLEGGINDISVGIPLKRTFANYESIVDTLLKHEIDPILQSTLYINRDTDSLINLKVDTLNRFLQEMASMKKIGYIDVNSAVSVNKRLKKNLTYDGVHLNEMGYKLWLPKLQIVLKKRNI